MTLNRQGSDLPPPGINIETVDLHDGAQIAGSRTPPHIIVVFGHGSVVSLLTSVSNLRQL